jgi:hypothetical protein
VPLEKQKAPNNPLEARILIASETIWLRSLVPSFVDTVSTLLRSPISISTEQTPSWASPALKILNEDYNLDQCKVLIWIYRERGDDSSTVFTSFDFVKRSFEQAQCDVHEIHREPCITEPHKQLRLCFVIHQSARGQCIPLSVNL